MVISSLVNEQPSAENNFYYRLCLRHMGKNDNCFMFWSEGYSGYTRAIENAGFYLKEDSTKDDPIVSKEFVDKFKQKIRLPMYGEKEETYAGMNEFFILPNTGQVRQALGITTLDIPLTGDRNSFHAYFKDEVYEVFKKVKSTEYFRVKAKKHVSEYWCFDDIFKAENRNKAILMAFNEWMPAGYDSYLEFKNDVSCKRDKTIVFDRWKKY